MLQSNGSTRSMVAGSLGAVAKENGHSLAMGFMGVKALVMIDISASMMTADCGDGQTRYALAKKQLEKLQAENSGEIAVATFSSHAQFCPDGVIGPSTGMTDMAAVLRLALMADNTGIKLILISDGEPDSESEALAAASKFKSKIDTVFVGSETGYGRDFLKRLSAMTGGISINTELSQMGKLSSNITKLLGA